MSEVIYRVNQKNLRVSDFLNLVNKVWAGDYYPLKKLRLPSKKQSISPHGKISN